VDGLTFDFDQAGDVVVASVDGEIDFANASELGAALAERLPRAATALALDLSRVEYLDSSGVELLFDLARRLAARRQAIRLVVPEAAPVRRVLELSAMESVVPMDADLPGALGAIAGSTS
jgi:anti-anti-sigma factor